jgi:hypothetical protein
MIYLNKSSEVCSIVHLRTLPLKVKYVNELVITINKLKPLTSEFVLNWLGIN